MATERQRKNKKPAERQEEILNTAEELFRKKGFLETSIADIIEAAGVSHGAIYHHFPSKKSILLGLVKNRMHLVRVKLRGWIDDTSLTPREKIELVLKQFNSLRNLRMTMDFVGFGFVREDPEIHNAVVQLSFEPLSRDLAEIIEQGVASGDFDVPDPLAVAVTIILLLAEFFHRAGTTETVVQWPVLFESLQLSIMRMLGVRNTADARNLPARGR